MFWPDALPETWEVDGIRQKGCRKKTWWDCVKNNTESLGMSRKDVQFGNKWRTRIQLAQVHLEKWMLKLSTCSLPEKFYKRLNGSWQESNWCTHQAHLNH